MKRTMDTIPAIPHDDALPQLAQALDPDAMQAAFEASVFGADARCRVRACQLERIRYKPGKKCLVCYRLQIDDAIGQGTREQLITVRLYQAGGSHSRFARAGRETLVAPKFGRPLTHLPDLDMVAWSFPNDRKLKGLPRLADPAYLRAELLSPLVARHVGANWRIAALTHELAHYNPEHTCTVRVELQLEHNQTGERQSCVLYGKTYYDDEGAKTYEVMRQLWEQQHGAPGGLRIPQPLDYDPKLRLLWQEGLPGQTLTAIEMESSDFPVWLERAAVAVAALHQARVACNRSASLDASVAKLKEMREWLPSVRPSCRPLLEPLVDHLVAHAAFLGEQPNVLLHGDLHSQNFLLVGQEVALIDLDDATCGSPWQDIAGFIASLLHRGLTLWAPGAVLANAVAVFLRSYKQNAPWRIAPQNLNWFVATYLIIQRVAGCVTRLEDGHFDLIDALVALAAQVSDRGARLPDDENS